VVLARSLREAAAQLLEAAPIDLILLDVMLPDGESYGFCKQLRDSGQYLPVIMLTARSAAEERVRGLDSGADDYMPKPFVLSELLARVRSALRRSGWRQQDAPADETTRGKLRFGSARSISTHQSRLPASPVRMAQLELDLLLFLAERGSGSFAR
jgi:DNA-binding response OmpR family regulator